MGKAKGAVSNVKKVVKSEKAKASVTETKTYKIGKGKAGKGEGKRASGSKEKKHETPLKDTQKKKEPPRDDKKNDKGKKALQVESTEIPKKRVSAIKSAAGTEEPKRRVSFKQSPTVVCGPPNPLETPPPKKPLVPSETSSPCSPTQVSLESLEVWKSEAASQGLTLEAYMEDISRKQLEKTVEGHMKSLVVETEGSGESGFGDTSEELESPAELGENEIGEENQEMEEEEDDEEEEEGSDEGHEGEGEEEEEMVDDREVEEDTVEEKEPHSAAAVKDQVCLVMGDDKKKNKGFKEAVRQQVETNEEKKGEFSTANSALAKKG